MTDPIRVLVVDDSPLFRECLRLALNHAPDIKVVGTAIDGKDAIFKATELKPDVITMDVMMPGLDGISAVRKISNYLHVPVLIVTALATDTVEPDGRHQNQTVVQQALNAGAADVWPKPCSLPPKKEESEALITHLRHLAQKRRSTI